MTIDDAIAKAKRDGDVQLAEWLRRARGADAAGRWYAGKLRVAHRNMRKVMNHNKKLRELVKDMLWAWWACDDESCVHHGECDVGEEMPVHGCLLKQRARELGIEVKP